MIFNIINYNFKIVFFKFIKIYIKLTILIVIIKIDINNQNFLKKFENFYFFVDK